jgi:hypothetical protein
MDAARAFPERPGRVPPEKDRIEQKTEELILMTGAQGPRRWRQRKGEYLRKLEQDNLELKGLIVELQQQISANQAQKDILRDQLTYFQSCLAQAAPLHRAWMQRLNFVMDCWTEILIMEFCSWHFDHRMIIGL